MLFAKGAKALKPLDAEVVLLGGDGRLAYPCGPSGEALLGTVTVAVNGDQAGTAILRSDVTYRLVVTGTASERIPEKPPNEFDAFYCFGGFCSIGPFSDSRLIGVAIIPDSGQAPSYVGLSSAIDGPYPPFEGGHRYEVTYRPPVDGRIALRSPPRFVGGAVQYERVLHHRGLRTALMYRSGHADPLEGGVPC